MSQTEKVTLVNLHASAIQATEKALNTAPGERNTVVDGSERAVVRLRDALIEQFRQEQDGQRKAGLRNALDQVNIAVSLITGVEFPGAGIQEKPIRQAEDILKALDFSMLEKSPGCA